MAAEHAPLTLRVVHGLTPADRGAVLQFLAEARAREGQHLDDHLVADLRSPRPGFSAALIERATPEGGQFVLGYGQATSANDGFIVDALVASTCPGDRDAHRLDLLRTVIGHVPANESITWWAHHGDHDQPLAATLGMASHRSLLQMRRPLPLEGAIRRYGDLVTRPFKPGIDDQRWLDVNNAAFEWHGEQGGWDLPTLHQRIAEPWFTTEGFLLHEIDGELAGFCWTKLHPADDATPHAVGEIYVIAVHPSFHGRGLGRALTVAGLNHLHSVGAREGMLYVDGANTSAVRLYESLGFSTADVAVAFRRDAGSAA